MTTFLPCFFRAGSKVKNRRDMYNHARKQLRKEFDVLNLIKRMRKFDLIKQVILRQYQRRMLVFAKKCVVRPPKP